MNVKKPFVNTWIKILWFKEPRQTCDDKNIHPNWDLGVRAQQELREGFVPQNLKVICDQDAKVMKNVIFCWLP